MCFTLEANTASCCENSFSLSIFDLSLVSNTASLACLECALVGSYTPTSVYFQLLLYISCYVRYAAFSCTEVGVFTTGSGTSAEWFKGFKVLASVAGGCLLVVNDAVNLPLLDIGRWPSFWYVELLSQFCALECCEADSTFRFGCTLNVIRGM